MNNGLEDTTRNEPQAITWDNFAMNPLQWNFLNEPAWKWGVFVVAMSLFLASWAGVVRFMK